jgi:putative two-component system hydrogenase maturation factor HypX/HoxX
VVGREGVVLNPHYKTLGLTGSEYHTYTLPKRVGSKRAQQLLDACLPLSVTRAEEIGMIDAVFAHEGYEEALHAYALSRVDDAFLWEKQEYLEANREQIEACKEREIEVMYPEFWEEKSPFHRLRQEFVYKVCPRETPERLKVRSKK